MKPVTITINDFSGGISDDIRQPLTNSFALTRHVDIFSNPKRATPYRSLEADENDGSTSDGMKQYYVQDFLYASASAKLYGLGKNATGKTKIVYKADATTGNWTLPANSEGNGAVQNGCLVEYKDYLWGFQGTTDVFKWGVLSGTPSITNTTTTIGTITSVAQGVIASDDNLYLPYNNKLVRVNAGGTVQDAVLTLPTNFKITSICNYGKQLAIGCAPISTFNGTSKVFLWNLTSPDVQEAIGWGEGELRVLEEIEGYLVGVTDRYLNNAVGAGKGSLIIQIYSGGVPQVVKELFTKKLTGKIVPLSKAVKNNRLFFSARIYDDAVASFNDGIWSFGRKNANYPFAISLDISNENFQGNHGGIQSFSVAGNYFFLSHNDDGSIYKTSSTETYSNNYASSIQTQIYNFGSPMLEKRLDSVKISVVPQATPQAFYLRVKPNGSTTWTLLATPTVAAGELSKTVLLNEVTGANFPSAKEFQFQVSNFGGLEITEIEPTATPLSTI